MRCSHTHFSLICNTVMCFLTAELDSSDEQVGAVSSYQLDFPRIRSLWLSISRIPLLAVYHRCYCGRRCDSPFSAGLGFSLLEQRAGMPADRRGAAVWRALAAGRVEQSHSHDYPTLFSDRYPSIHSLCPTEQDVLKTKVSLAPRRRPRALQVSPADATSNGIQFDGRS